MRQVRRALLVDRDRFPSTREKNVKRPANWIANSMSTHTPNPHISIEQQEDVWAEMSLTLHKAVMGCH